MPEHTSSVRDYLQLFRVSNVFTALADVTMGFLFVHAQLRPLSAFLALAAASAFLYTAGMVLNDVCDIQQDQLRRPTRPVASGRIALRHARRVGVGLLLSGIVLGWAAGFVAFGDWEMPWRSGMTATALALLIVLYDSRLKRTVFGPLAMGSCRALNVLLGMSVGTLIGAEASVVMGFTTAQLLAAAGLGIYIVGVTWFARREATASRRWQLAVATVVMASGIAVLGLIYHALPAAMPKTLAQESTWFLLLGLLAFTIVRRCAMAVAEPSPKRVQLAVKNAIWSLILLDASVVLLVCPPAWSLAIVAMLVPTMILGRWISAT